MSKPKAVLIVDDEPHTIRMIRMNLEHAGYQVEGVCDGQMALQLLSCEGPFGAVILDRRMRGLQGDEVLKAIRAGDTEGIGGTCRDIPILMITGEARDEGVTPDLLAAGATVVVAKPLNPMELRVHLRELVGEPGQSPGV